MHWTDTWYGYLVANYDHTVFARGARVLDLGLGSGDQMRALRTRGCWTVGVDIDRRAVAAAAAAGLGALVARGEELPFRTGAFDGVVSKVVLPYTDEARAVAEIARVLRPGGECELSVHGAGYYLAYLVTSPSLRRRIYALRTLLNTWLYALTGTRRVGDTIYQTLPRLRRYFACQGLAVARAVHGPPFLGVPVFVHVRLRRT
ncbi:MAG: class I SAM-dependent methyltransferase [Candidatus Rokubacteria bacterium]|nr:class I SAM-dependent methyltransferase [Candidatus Rokubacteria bacterium]